MSDLRKAAIGTSLILWSAAAFGASFEKGALQIPGTLPVRLSLPFASIPADALQALDPLSKIQPVIPAAAAPAGVPAAASKASIMAAGSDRSSSRNESAESQRQRLDGQFDNSGELPAEPEFNPPAAIGTGGVVKAPLPNPAKYYEQAYEEAVYQASLKKIDRAGVTFREATATLPTPAGARHDFSYTFDARGADGKTYVIYVDFAAYWAGASQRYGSRASMSQAPSGYMIAGTSEASQPAAVSRVMRAAPETALRLAREKSGLAASVSYAVRPDARGGLSYNFFDGEGWHVTVDARTGKASVLRRPAESREKIKARLIRRIRSYKAPKVSWDEIRAAAAEVAKYKGMPWSHSEYDGYRINAAESLRQRGATTEQLREFEALLEKAPLLGGRFNPWAGD